MAVHLPAPRTKDKSPREEIELDARRLAEVVDAGIVETLDSSLMSYGFVGREEKECYCRLQKIFLPIGHNL